MEKDKEGVSSRDFFLFVEFLNKFKRDCREFCHTLDDLLSKALEIRKGFYKLKTLFHNAMLSCREEGSVKKRYIITAYEIGVNAYKDEVEGVITHHEERERRKREVFLKTSGDERVLPEVHEFDGEPGAFKKFLFAFDCSVHSLDIPDSEKLRLLKFYLVGPAGELVEDYQESKVGDYTKAYNLVIQTYDDEGRGCSCDYHVGISGCAAQDEVNESVNPCPVPDCKIFSDASSENSHIPDVDDSSADDANDLPEHGPSEAPSIEVIKQAFQQFVRIPPCFENRETDMCNLFWQISTAYRKLMNTKSLDLGNDLLVLMALPLLPGQLSKEFEMMNPKIPEFQKLLEFLQQKAFKKTSPKEMNGVCHICKGDHDVKDCFEFEKMSFPLKRAYFEIHEELCKKCLSQSHSTAVCVLEETCIFCVGDHCSMIHATSKEIEHINRNFGLNVKHTECRPLH